MKGFNCPANCLVFSVRGGCQTPPPGIFAPEDSGTDNNMVVGTLKIQRIKQVKMPKITPRFNIQLINDEQIKNKLQEKIEGKIRNAEEWQKVKSAILETAEKTLGKKKLEARKPWMKEEILKLIDKQNKLYKLSPSHTYKNLKGEIQYKCREAKDRKMKEECAYIQALEESNNTRELYQRIKKFNNNQEFKAVANYFQEKEKLS